jgi:signal transduction histidine kinase
VTEKQAFRISTGLKDLIGRDLITDDFVAVFELVKNSFDAHAKKVLITFEEDTITIADNGKGMSRDDILNKWLFVAYSAKREGTEDDDYRDHIVGRARAYAGAKGVGRFSCDRLGSKLTLNSRAPDNAVQILDVDWRLYEEDAKEEFGAIQVELGEAADFPDDACKPTGTTGTVLRISRLRSQWNRSLFQALKRELTKLIDPFARESRAFEIEIVVTSEAEADAADAKHNASLRDDQPMKMLVNGPIENPILEVLKQRTTVIRVALVDAGAKIESTLEDRGELIYRIRENNPYPGITETELTADVYFLNRSAKAVFAHRMGLPSVQFGSIFLFRNGFRVFPIGSEDDDFFGLTRRKQQGQRRFLGGRDLIGRVEIKGVAGFNEATSRNQGLIRNPQVDDLIDCIKDKCVRRLERYVVDITWKDEFDTDVADTSRVRRDESSALVAQLVSRLAATEGVELLDYNPELIRIVDEKSQAFEASLKALELLAEETGDSALLARVDEAKARIRALQAAESEAREAERRAETRAMAAESAAAVAERRFGEEKERNAFLVAAGSLDQDTILNLHHQIIIHASDVHLGVKRMMGKLRGSESISKDEWISFLEQVSFRNSQILTAARFATKGGYRQQSSEVEADLSVYIRDYIETISTLWAPRGVGVRVQAEDGTLKRRFRPIEVGIVIDNLISNAAKAHATSIGFFLAKTKGPKPMLAVDVADDGTGWPASLKPRSRVFEKGVTTTEGSGLGLFHVKQVVEGLGGTIEVVEEPYSTDLDGAHLRIRFPS